MTFENAPECRVASCERPAPLASVTYPFCVEHWAHLSTRALRNELTAKKDDPDTVARCLSDLEAQGII